jgi:hypothetical protein
MPTIQGLLNSQGYTPQQQSAITQQSLGASNTAFDALRERAADRTAATNNSAVYDDLTAARQATGAKRRVTGAAESDHDCEPAIEGTARRPQCPRPNLRSGYESSGEGSGSADGVPRQQISATELSP